MLTRRSFVKKSSFSAAAVAVLGQGTALASGYSTFIGYKMKCVSPTPGTAGHDNGPGHPGSHPLDFDFTHTEGEVYTIGFLGSPNPIWKDLPDPNGGPTLWEQTVEIQASLKTRAADKPLDPPYLVDHPFFSLTAFVRYYVRLKVPEGQENNNPLLEYSWDQNLNNGDGEWYQKLDGNGQHSPNQDPFRYPDHLAKATVECDHFTGNISSPDIGDHVQNEFQDGGNYFFTELKLEGGDAEDDDAGNPVPGFAIKAKAKVFWDDGTFTIEEDQEVEVVWQPVVSLINTNEVD